MFGSDGDGIDYVLVGIAFGLCVLYTALQVVRNHNFYFHTLKKEAASAIVVAEKSSRRLSETVVSSGKQAVMQAIGRRCSAGQTPSACAAPVAADDGGAPMSAAPADAPARVVADVHI